MVEPADVAVRVDAHRRRDAGEEDVLRKVFEDLKGAGVAVSEGEVRMKMAELLAQAQGRLDEAAAHLAVAETYAGTTPAARRRRLRVAGSGTEKA